MKSKKKKLIHKEKYLDLTFYKSFPISVTNPLDQYNKDKLNSFSIEAKRSRGNRVSDFTSWIYDSLIGKPLNKSLTEGKFLETILSKDIYMVNHYGKNYLQNSININEQTWRDYKFLSEEWELEFEDLSKEINHSFKISRLQINNTEMIGKPDVVYRNRRTGDRIIVEIKNTKMKTDIPTGGWYNLQCQLWSYSWIDSFADSPNIFLFGDIRRTKNRVDNHGRRIFEIYPSENSTYWRIRKNGQLNTDHKAVKLLHEQSLYMFKLYGGLFVGEDDFSE